MVAGLELVAGRHAERIGLLVEPDGPFAVVAQIAHDDARQALDAFEPHQVVGEHDEVEDQHARLMRHEIGPVARRRASAAGAVTILKSSAPSALVRM